MGIGIPDRKPGVTLLICMGIPVGVIRILPITSLRSEKLTREPATPTFSQEGRKATVEPEGRRDTLRSLRPGHAKWQVL